WRGVESAPSSALRAASPWPVAMSARAAARRTSRSGSPRWAKATSAPAGPRELAAFMAAPRTAGSRSLAAATTPRSAAARRRPPAPGARGVPPRAERAEGARPPPSDPKGGGPFWTAAGAPQRAERPQPHRQRRIVERLGHEAERLLIAETRQGSKRAATHAG